MNGESSLLRGRFSTAMGLLWLLLAAAFSEPVLAVLFSADGQLAPANRRVIWTVDVLLLILGVLSLAGRRRAWAVRMNFAALSAALCLGAVEIYLRLKQVDPVWAQEQVARIRVPDADLHHSLVPNSEGVIWWVNRKIRYAVNSAGFRDARVREVRPITASEARVVLLGDSFTEALGVEYEDCFAARLQEFFRREGRDVEVLNAGVAAYCPRIYRRRLQKFLAEGYSADVAVVMLDLTDIWDEAVFYSDTDFSAQAVEQLQASRRERIQTILQEQNRDRRYYMIYPAILIELGSIVEGWSVRDPWAWTEWYSDGAFAWTEDASFDKPWVAVGIERCKLHLGEIRDLCREHGIEMFLAVYPQPPQARSERRPSRAVEIFGEFARQEGIGFINLYPGFRELKDWRKAYIKWDNHFSPKGHEVVARQLHEELKQSSRKLLSAGQAP